MTKDEVRSMARAQLFCSTVQGTFKPPFHLIRVLTFTEHHVHYKHSHKEKQL